MLDRVFSLLEDIAAIEQKPQLSGRDYNMILGLNKDAKAQNS